MPAHEDRPSLRTSAAATAPLQLVLRRRRYRLPDQMASFRRFKLRQRGEMDDDTDDLLLR